MAALEGGQTDHRERSHQAESRHEVAEPIIILRRFFLILADSIGSNALIDILGGLIGVLIAFGVEGDGLPVR